MTILSQSPTVFAHRPILSLNRLSFCMTQTTHEELRRERTNTLAFDESTIDLSSIDWDRSNQRI